jgi:transcriptional regulator with XRE-family HTH domain
MDSAFVQLLKTMIPPVNTERFASRRAFIRAVGTDSEDGDQGYLTKVLKGTKPPPLARLDAWADALDIPDVERQRFKDLAAIAHLPLEVQSRFVGLLQRLKAKEDRLSAVEARLQAIDPQGDGVGKHV